MRRSCVVLFAVCLTPSLAAAQEAPQLSPPPSGNAQQPENQGFVAFAEFEGSWTKLGIVTSVDADFGYNFTPHIVGEAGIPLYFTRNPFSKVTTKDWRYVTLLGDPYIDARYTTQKFGLNVMSVLTGTFPVENSLRIFSTGRFGVDWFNHLDRNIAGFTGFVNAGASNGTMIRPIMPRPYSEARPYQTLGFMSDFEGGVSRTVFKRYSIGASGYALVPAGSQKVFSKFVAPDFPLGGDGSHNRAFDAFFESKGGTAIDRDNGYSGWVEVGPLMKHGTIQIGYAHSIHYALDTYSVMLKVDVGFLFRSPSQ